MQKVNEMTMEDIVLFEYLSATPGYFDAWFNIFEMELLEQIVINLIHMHARCIIFGTTENVVHYMKTLFMLTNILHRMFYDLAWILLMSSTGTRMQEHLF